MAFKSPLIAEEASYVITSDGKLVKTYNEVYRCTNNVHMILDDVVIALGILPGTPYVPYPFASARKINPKRLFLGAEGGAYGWEVSIEYSTETPTFSENPMDRPVKRRVYSTETQRVIFRDANGNIILNAAGDPPDGGVPINHHMPTVSWERNEDGTGFSMFGIAIITGKVNSDTFGGCAPGTLLMVAASEETFEGKYHYWKSTYQMFYNDQGWQPQFVNAGFYEAVGGLRFQIRDSNNQPVGDPQPLYGASAGANIGRQVPFGSRPADCNFIQVTYNGSMPFSSFGLSLA